MTANRRVFLNIIATYGRSVFALFCGLLTGRWTLMALGEVDYGLFGVVGGLTVFISYFNDLLSSAISRFYAYSVGRATKDTATDHSGLEECRQWFNTALSIHTIVPIVLIAIGYPVGVWAVRDFLTIPPDRVEACVWVFRFVCLSCFMSMVNVPVRAMYGAKQYIAELTIYSFVTTALNVVVIYYMVTHPTVWLVKYAAWTCFLSIAPQTIIMVRGFIIFNECRIVPRYLVIPSCLKRLGSFAGWQFFGKLGGMLRGQGMSILVNKFFGPRFNASMGVASTVNGQANMLGSALSGAFIPVITTAYGAGDIEGMKKAAFRSSKFATTLFLLFVIPLAIEIDNVLILWLKNPPPCTSLLCLAMMATLIFDTISDGHRIAVWATGNIAQYQLWAGGLYLLTLPLAYVLAKCNLSIVYVVGLSYVSLSAITAIVRVVYSHKLVGMSIRKWLFNLIAPIGLTFILAGIAGFIPRALCEPTFMRIVGTTFVTEIVYLPLVWFLVFDSNEREYVYGVIRSRIGRRK